MPAIFKGGDFAIVPRGSAHGYLEIKSKSYSSKVGQDIAEKLAFEEELIQPHLKERHPELKGPVGALRVVCLATKPDKKLRQLVKEKRAVILLDMDNGEVKPNPDGIWTLVNFLTMVRFRAREFQAIYAVNYVSNRSDEPQPKPAKQRNPQARNGGKAKAGRLARFLRCDRLHSVSFASLCHEAGFLPAIHTKPEVLPC